jgi:hypothetical protein
MRDMKIPTKSLVLSNLSTPTTLISEVFIGMRIFMIPTARHEMSTARFKYCKIQAPLRLLTAGVWAILPFNWPCFVDYPASESENMELHIQGLKRAAHEMGGNLVIISSVGDRSNTSVSNFSGAIVSNTTVVKGARVIGFAVREKR